MNILIICAGDRSNNSIALNCIKHIFKLKKDKIMGIFFGWIIFSFVVGFIGSERKIGFWGAFFLSILLSPLIGLIIALVSKNKEDFIEDITSRKKPLVLNLSEVSFVDSTGLGFLVAMQQAQSLVDEAFVICALTDKTRLLLELTRLNLVFDIYETEALAVSALTRLDSN